MHFSPFWSLTRRITLSITIQAIIFGITIMLAIIDTSQYQQLFFFVTLICGAVISIANGIHQNCIFGITSSLPTKYSNILMSGVCFSGLITSIFYFASLIVTNNMRLSAIYYFVVGFVIVLLFFDCYYTFSLSVSVE